MGEEWRAVPGYEGFYEVSNLGRVRGVDRLMAYKGAINQQALKRGTVLKGAINRGGYWQLVLCRDGKQRTFEIHRLVALAWLSQPEGLNYVNHINGNKTDNRMENLEWCTQRHNVNSGQHVKRFAPEFIQQVLDLWIQGKHATAIADEIGVERRIILRLTASWRDHSS